MDEGDKGMMVLTDVRNSLPGIRAGTKDLIPLKQPRIREDLLLSYAIDVRDGFEGCAGRSGAFTCLDVLELF